MIRFLFRFLGLWILAAAFLLFVYDGTKSIAGNACCYITKTGALWSNIHQSSLLLLQPAIERHLSFGPWLWQSVIQPFFLEAPACVVLGIVGILFILLGRKKKPLIGYARD